MRRVRTLPLLLVVAGLAACASPADEAPPPIERPEGWVACTEPRPEVCTREFRPVCAVRDTSVRCATEPCDRATERVTKPNACDACTDPDVIGHVPGACGDDGGPGGETMLDY